MEVFNSLTMNERNPSCNNFEVSILKRKIDKNLSKSLEVLQTKFDIPLSSFNIASLNKVPLHISNEG